jgi:hypothetical protein
LTGPSSPSHNCAVESPQDAAAESDAESLSSSESDSSSSDSLSSSDSSSSDSEADGSSSDSDCSSGDDQEEEQEQEEYEEQKGLNLSSREDEELLLAATEKRTNLPLSAEVIDLVSENENRGSKQTPNQANGESLGSGNSQRKTEMELAAHAPAPCSVFFKSVLSPRNLNHNPASPAMAALVQLEKERLAAGTNTLLSNVSPTSAVWSP